MMLVQQAVPAVPDVTTHLVLIADTIRTAVAPVFLLTGVGAVLSVLTGRLARIVDHGRAITAELPRLTPEMVTRKRGELRVLSKRVRIVNVAITLTTVTALMVCSVIMLLFVGALIHVDVASWISVVFIGAMVAFIAALLGFLHEVHLSTSVLRFDVD